MRLSKCYQCGRKVPLYMVKDGHRHCLPCFEGSTPMNDIPEEARLTDEEITAITAEWRPFTTTPLPMIREITQAQLKKAIPIITKQAQAERDKDYDPQAETVGRFIEMGWTPPAELDSRIKQAQEDESKRIGEMLVTKLMLNEKTIISGKTLTEIITRIVLALKSGRDPSQEGGE